ncbi:MAG TPA: L-lactate permease [Chloroflexota bacterium]
MVLIGLPPSLLPVLATVPIVVLLVGLAALGWSAPRAALVGFGLATLLAIFAFGLEPGGAAVALAKALLLSLFVLTIVWAALFLHAVLERLGAVEAIGAAMASATPWEPARALLLAWGFSGFVQGFAGAGAPVASVVPLLRMVGFAPLPSAAAAMVGHSWAITFGSMGSSYFAIQLVTRIPGDVLAPWLGALFVLPIIFTGLAVLHILLGWKGVRSGGVLAVGVGGAMAATLWITAAVGAGAVASVAAAMIGCVGLLLIGRVLRPAMGSDDTASFSVPEMNIHLALLPYYLLIALTFVAQAGPLAPLARSVVLGVDLPSTTTALAYGALAETTYPRLRVFQHPAAIIAVAIFITALWYRARGQWRAGTLGHSLAAVYQRAGALSVTVLFMVMMALIMADAGMIGSLALGLRDLVGPTFPFLSPLLGVLGALMTGSNTSSNVAMGVLQVETAAALGLSPALIAAAQSVGGSIGAGVSPDKAVIGAHMAGLRGSEAAITRRALPYALLIACMVGLEVLLLAHWFPG